MHAFWTSDFVKDIIGIIGNVVGGIVLLLVRRWMRNMERDHAEHKKEIAAKLSADVSPGVHSRSAAAGAHDNLDRADSKPIRGNGGLPDRKR